MTIPHRVWPKPDLTKVGQEVFREYADVSIMPANQGEAEAVHRFVESGNFDEIIDLQPGSIREKAAGILGGNRLLLLGLYSVEAFLSADEARGIPESGFDRYLANHETLGDCFWYDILIQEQTGDVRTVGLRLSLLADDENPSATRDALRGMFTAYANDYGNIVEKVNVVAIQVVSCHRDRNRFYLSHWYTGSVGNYLRTVFPEEKFEMSCESFSGGRLYAVKRVGSKPTGLVTFLGNALGNLMPHEQLPTLTAISNLF